MQRFDSVREKKFNLHLCRETKIIFDLLSLIADL